MSTKKGFFHWFKVLAAVAIVAAIIIAIITWGN